MLRDLVVPGSPSMISTVAGALRRNGDGKLRVTRSLRAVEGELHFVPGDARQIQPVDRHGQLAELEVDGELTALHVDVFQARRLTEDTADGVELVDQGVQQDRVVFLAQERGGLTDGAGDAGRGLGV